MKLYAKIALGVAAAAIIAVACYDLIPQRIEQTLDGIRFPVSDPEEQQSAAVTIEGQVRRRLFGDDYFIGDITFGNKKLTDIYLYYKSETRTMVLNEYKGSRLDTYGIVLLLKKDFSGIAAEIFNGNSENEYLICGMSADEFEAEMKRLNYYVPYLDVDLSNP